MIRPEACVNVTVDDEQQRAYSTSTWLVKDIITVGSWLQVTCVTRHSGTPGTSLAGMSAARCCNAVLTYYSELFNWRQACHTKIDERQKCIILQRAEAEGQQEDTILCLHKNTLS